MQEFKTRNRLAMRKVIDQKVNLIQEQQLKLIYLAGLHDGLKLNAMSLEELVSIYGDHIITQREGMLTQ